ncbi:MAG: protein kinase [Planctomycetes bacterium]|nr:protein kinase [Planctomycetota bacterium]
MNAPAESSSPGVPTHIGGYRLEGELGRGAMGVVYRAVHETLERPVALKFLPHEYTNNPESVARFLREARTVATIRNDHVVQVYDAGEENGKYYIAMELVDGVSLKKHLQEKKRLSEEEGLELMAQAALGLAAAHVKGLVHRDVKPDNMLLDKDRKHLRIVDFGLVTDSASDTQLTATGAYLGTPQYMSAEQADGEKADARSDLYALGVTFYEAFTGRPPFTAETALNLLFKHRFEEPPAPSSVLPAMSRSLNNLLLTLMAKKPEQRVQSAARLAELIDGLKKGEKIPEPPPFESPLKALQSSPDLAGADLAPAREPSAARGPLALAGMLLALLVVAVIAWTLIFGGGEKRPAASDSSSSGNAGPLVAPGDTKTPKSNGGSNGTSAVKTPAPNGTAPAPAPVPDNLPLPERIRAHVKNGSLSDARKLLNEARQERPQDEGLLSMDQGLGALEKIETILDELAPLFPQAVETAKAATENDLEDGLAGKLLAQFREEQERIPRKREHARDLFERGNYGKLPAMVDDAKAYADKFHDGVNEGKKRFDAAAKKERGEGGLIGTITGGNKKGDAKLAVLYQQSADAFEALRAKAAPLRE